MILLVLEALGALALLVLIVWWTMFSGRERGELPSEPGPQPEPKPAPPPDTETKREP
jgi:hypothetical protein